MSINNLSKEELQQRERIKFLQSNLEEAADIAMWKELEDWDVTLLDGLDDEQDVLK